MLSKSRRLVRNDFSKRALRSVPFAFGSIKVLDGPSWPDRSKAAVVVSKKVLPYAVSRNALRRRVYAILREKFRTGAITHTLIVYPNKKASVATFAELASELERALVRC